MGLYKPIKQPDGVVTNYHRILFCQFTTNRQNSIAVVSYVDKESRDKEKNGDPEKPYQQVCTYETKYDPLMTIYEAYSYLKTLPQFEGSEDT